MSVRRVVVPVPNAEERRAPALDPRRVLVTVLLNVAAVAFVSNELKKQGAVRTAANVINYYNPWTTNCGLLKEKEYLVTSDRVVAHDMVLPGIGAREGGGGERRCAADGAVWVDQRGRTRSGPATGAREKSTGRAAGRRAAGGRGAGAGRGERGGKEGSEGRMESGQGEKRAAAGQACAEV